MQNELEYRQYHIKSDDFLGTEATKIEIVRYYAGKEKFNIRSDGLLRDIRDNLVYLQQNYIIVERDTTTLFEDVARTDRFIQNILLTFLLFNKKSAFMAKKKGKITMELEHYLKKRGLDVNTIAKLNVEGFTKLFDLNKEGFDDITKRQKEIHVLLPSCQDQFKLDYSIH